MQMRGSSTVIFVGTVLALATLLMLHTGGWVCWVWVRGWMACECSANIAHTDDATRQRSMPDG